MADALGGKDKPIDFGNFIGGEEALQIAARSLRSLKKDVTDLSKTVADDSGRIKAGFETIKTGIADIQSKAGKLNLFSGEDKAVLTALAQQLGELKKRQEDYKATQVAQATIQRGLTDTAKQYTSELAKQKDALRAAALAQDVEGQKAAAAAIRQTTQETAQLSKALRGANSEFTAAKGSYDALVIENNKLLASLHALEGGLNSGSQEALKLKKQIYDNTQTLKDFDEATNRNFRNVGNYAQSFSGLIAELAKARAAQASFSEGTADAARNQMRIAGFQTAAQKAAANMGLSYEQAEAKINGVTAAIQPLAISLVRLEQEQVAVGKSAGEDTEAYRKIGFQIQQTKKEIQDIAAATTQVDVAQGGLEEQLGFTREALEQYVTQLAVGALGLQAIVSGVQSVFQANVEYSRNLAEVRKTTGLTADEAERLAQSLKALDTPTSLAGLLKIAGVGGQLGIAKGDLLEFTKAIDTAVQALGNDYAGGAEEIATTLGTISKVFGKELGNDAAKNILAIGSAVNQLGAEGSATAPFLTDVATRVGAVATQSGLALKDVLAYAAVLQETGTRAEVAGSSLNRLFSTLSTKTEESFRIAQKANPALTLKEFTRLVNTDFNAAIQVFLKGLNAGNASTTEVAKRLATLKLESGEAKSAILTLAQNTQLFAERQKTANDQLRDATSLADEAKVNVETLAGSVDGFSNDLKNFVTTGGGSSFLKFLVDLERDAYKLTLLPFKLIGDGIGYLKDKLTGAKKPQDDYTIAVVANTRELLSQADAQQKLLDSYTKLAATTARTGAQELELQQLRAKLGTDDLAAVQAGIDKRKTQAETNIDQLRDQLAQQLRIIEQYSQQAAVLQARVNEAPKKDGRLTSFAGQKAADELLRTQAAINEADEVRKNVLAALAKLEGQHTQAVKDGTAAAGEAEKVDLQLDRAAQERAKNRASRLRDELADNQKRIDAVKAYQAEQGKLFADKQITPEIFAERVRGSEDLITQYERDGTALRIKIVRAESDEKLAVAENDRIRQSKKKDISEAELRDIQQQYSLRRVEIRRQEARQIAQINDEAGKRQGAVEPLEFKVPSVDIELLRSRLGEYVKTYESELGGIKNAEQAREKDLIGQLSRREISQNEFEKRASQSRIKAANEALALDKKYHKATLDSQKDANEAALAEQNRLTNERIAKIEAIGYYTQEAESAFFAIKGNFIDADIQRTQAAYDNEIKAAGENSVLKLQVQNKYDKELKKLNYEKAKAERDGALFSIAINTAIAVAKSFAKSPETFGLPFSAIAIGEGILQAAVVLSKPLPQYFKGRKGGPAEFAEVAERGPEIIERKDTKRFEYVSTRGVAKLGAGDNVYSAEQTTEMLAAVGLGHNEAQQPARVAAAFSGAAAGARAGREDAAQGGTKDLLAAMHTNTDALRKLKQVTVNVHRGSDASVQTSQSLTHYATQRTFR